MGAKYQEIWIAGILKISINPEMFNSHCILLASFWHERYCTEIKLKTVKKIIRFFSEY